MAANLEKAKQTLLTMNARLRNAMPTKTSKLNSNNNEENLNYYNYNESSTYSLNNSTTKNNKNTSSASGMFDRKRRNTKNNTYSDKTPFKSRSRSQSRGRRLMDDLSAKVTSMAEQARKAKQSLTLSKVEAQLDSCKANLSAKMNNVIDHSRKKKKSGGHAAGVYFYDEPTSRFSESTRQQPHSPANASIFYAWIRKSDSEFIV